MIREYLVYTKELLFEWEFFICQIGTVKRGIFEDLEKRAERAFSEEYKKSMQEKSPHYKKSLIARYLVSDAIFKKTWWRHSVPYWEYVCNPISNHTLWFSYSFIESKEKMYVVVALSKSKIWVDAECVKPRHESLLAEYSSRDGFYKKRTAKEAIVKYIDHDFNDVELINISSYPVQTFEVPLDEKIIVSIVT